LVQNVITDKAKQLADFKVRLCNVRNREAVNGLCAPTPSSAVWPSLAAIDDERSGIWLDAGKTSAMERDA